MLDTCILVDFSFIYAKEDKKQKLPDRLKKSKELLTKLENTKFFNVMTYWNKWELRKVISDIKLEQKFVESGYSPREFGDARREINLEESELKLVNKVVFDFWKYSTRDTAELDKEDFGKIEHITKRGFEFMDCLLIIQAKKLGCNLFITRDNKLRLIKKLSRFLGIEIIGVKEFLGKLSKNKSPSEK